MIVAALTILAPLAAAALILLLRRGAAAIALLGAAVGAVAAPLTLSRVATQPAVAVTVRLFGAGMRQRVRPSLAATLPGLPGLPLRVAADPFACVLLVTVAVVVLLVVVYAVGYMRPYRDHARFFAALSLFAAAMQTLVLAADWVLFLAAYEIIGLASYLLIGFWYERPGIASAATRAFLTTRATDLGLYLAIFVLAAQAGTTAIAPALEVSGAPAVAAGLLLLLSAMGKAAQVPFQGWLQDAMVAPTPVSALLHAATLVVAGAILLARALPLLPPEVLLAVGAAGGVTAVVGGLMAMAQGDLKRLLAASTSSQLGFMFLALGAGSLGAAVALLVIHAALKSALFMGAGIYQEAYGSTHLDALQGAGRAHRWTYVLLAVAGLSLAGIPPLAGFWAKDAVASATLAAPSSGLLGALALVGALLTGCYVGRALRLLWRGRARRGAIAGLGWMIAGLVALAVLATTLGLAVRPIGLFLSVPIPRSTLGVTLDLEAAFLGLLAGWLVPGALLPGPLHRAAAAGFRVGGGFDGLVARPALALARRADEADRALHRGVLGVGRLGLLVAQLARRADEQGLDRLIAALVRGIRALGERARELQSGLVHRELVYALGGVAVLIALLLIIR